MAQRGITEFDAKRMLATAIDGYDGEVVLVRPGETLKNHEKDHPWLKAKKLVVKPDQLFGKRGKNNLIGLGLDAAGAGAWIAERMNKEVTLLSGVKGTLDTFLVEPMTPHESEYYVAMKASETHDSIYLSAFGGVDVEENWGQVREMTVANMGTLDAKKLEGLAKEICAKKPADVPVVVKFVEQLFGLYVKGGFVYLEINPFAVAGANAVPLDCVAKVDDTAEFECRGLWGALDFPPPFGQRLSAEEMRVKELDAMSGASLKLRVLNPDGRVWNMVAGGGASVIYADTVADLGAASELAMYGEYSGDPSTQLTYEYAKVIMDLMTRKPDAKGRPKVLLIGGGIANFTDVAKTFTGIINAMGEYAEKMKKVKTHIFVRRGGPNYKVGLRNIQEAADRLGLPIHVHGPETHMTDIVRMALAQA
jgi:ATP-citrate lyase beta-subunit